MSTLPPAAPPDPGGCFPGDAAAPPPADADGRPPPPSPPAGDALGMTRLPAASLLAISPRWYCPMTSSRHLACSVLASVLYRSTKRFVCPSLPMYMFGVSMVTDVQKFASKSLASSSMAWCLGWYSTSEIDRIRSPTMASCLPSPSPPSSPRPPARLSTYSEIMWPWWPVPTCRRMRSPATLADASSWQSTVLEPQVTRSVPR
mmetsp:Transcript_31664/g.70943  ORF Transcript_31664/g.70943 Transcript_31664/m.70943 type:complete len:203 (+) Transcript_31664:1429-2037(+)